MNQIADIFKPESFSQQDIVRLLSAADPEDIEQIRKRAMRILETECGLTVYYRGLRPDRIFQRVHKRL